MASDGKVVIDVILDDGTVAKGVANIDKKLGGVAGAGRRAASGIKEIVTALGLVAAASKALDMMTSSLDGAISRYDTLQGFPVIMERMGFNTDVARKAIEKLSEGIQGLPTTLDGIVANTQRIALLTGDLDMATDTALALNNAFLASGSSASDAERGLTQYVQMLSKGKVDAQSWVTLQETMGYALNKTAEAFGYTGRSAQNDLYNALKKGEITFDEFNAKLIELNNASGGFAEIAKSSTAGIGTAFTNMKTAVVRGVTEIIAEIDNVLANTPLQSIQHVIESMGRIFFNVLKGIATLIAATEGPLQSFFALFENGAETLKNAFNEGGINGLIQAFVGMIPQLYKVGMEIIQNIIKGFNDNVHAFAETALNAVQTWITNLGSILPEILKLATNMAVTLIDGLAQSFPELAKTASDIITTVIQTILQSLPKILESGIKILQSVVKGIVDTLPDLVAGIAQLIATVVDTIVSMLPEILKMGVELVISLIHGILDALPNIIDTVVDLLSALIDTIIDNLPSFITAAIDIILALIDGIVKASPKILNAIITLIGKLVELILANLPKFIGAAIQIVLALVEGIIRAIPQIVKAVFEMIGLMVLELVNYDWKSVGEDIVQGIINGIKKMAANAWEAAKSVGATIVDGFKSFLKIQSPSKVMMELGEWTGLGIAKGIEATKKDNQKVIEELGQILINKTHDYESELAKLRKEYAKAEKGDREKINKDIIKLQEGFEKRKLDAIQKFVKQKKDLEQLSLVQEVRIWEESLKHFKAGTDEKIEAQIAYKNALKAVNDEIVKINQDYSNRILEVNENLKKGERELTEVYNKALDDRTKSLYSFAGIFDEIQEKTDVFGFQLIDNLKAQVETFAEWSKNIKTLAERGIDEGLLAELQNMGPKAAAEIRALTQLSEEQLIKYQELWREKNRLAREQAIEELQGLREETELNIMEMRKASEKQLDELHKEWQDAIRSVVVTSDNELASLKQVGINAGQGLLNGLASMEPALLAKARAIANAIKATIQSALQIHSPSRWMRDFVAGNMAKGFVEGVDKYEKLITTASDKMANFIKPSFINPLRGVKPSFGPSLAAMGSSSTTNNQYSYDQSRKMDNTIHITVKDNNEVRELEKTLKRLEYGFSN